MEKRRTIRFPRLPRPPTPPAPDSPGPRPARSTACTPARLALVSLIAPIQVAPDTTTATAYDTVWAHPEAPVQTLNWLDQFMLSQDKLFVVLAVVLIIWFGLVFFVFRTDRRLNRLERILEERIAREKD